MEPYTVAGMARQDCSAEGSEGRGDGASGGSPRKKVTISENYELVGVVVHSGQAHAGHYYSFIKDRRYVAPQAWFRSWRLWLVSAQCLSQRTLKFLRLLLPLTFKSSLPGLALVARS